MSEVATTCEANGLRLGRRVGEGGFSTVYSAVDERCNHERVAVKVTRPSAAVTVDVQHELVALQELSDLPHVVGMKRHFREGQRHFVVMELARGEELFSIVQSERKLTEDVARNIVRQVLQTVKGIHARGWVHRDLKLENVITTGISAAGDSTNKIIDFGFATRQTRAGAHCAGIIGTAHYVAPEVVWGSSYDGRAVDMFAIGVMLYVMLYGCYPFPRRGNFGVGPRMRSTDKNAFRAQYTFPHRHDVSEDAKNMIRSLLQAEPADRPTAHQALVNAWMDPIDDMSPEDPASAVRTRGSPRGLPAPLVCTPPPQTPPRGFHFEATTPPRHEGKVSAARGAETPTSTPPRPHGTPPRQTGAQYHPTERAMSAEQEELKDESKQADSPLMGMLRRVSNSVLGVFAEV